MELSRDSITTSEIRIEGKKVYLRRVKHSDVGPEYLSWLTEPEVNQYLERRFETHTIDSLHTFVDSMAQSKDSLFLAIIHKETGTHVGNIKLGPINFNHGYAEMGILVGNKKFWGLGLGSDAIQALSDYGLKKIGLNRIFAGAYDLNIGSIKAFEKAGFSQEGILRKQFLCHGKYINAVLMGKLASEALSN